MNAATHPGMPKSESSIPRRILVVEDDAYVREAISQYLQIEGYDVVQAANGVDALKLAAAHPPDLVILDVMLPGMDGFEVASRMRAVSAVPILIVTGRVDEADKLAGFGVGADDYITKPFRPRELIMRVQAILRRMDAGGVPAMILDDALRVGDLVIRPQLREAVRDGVELDLTAKEFDLLYFLASHPKQVFTRQQLLQHVWHYSYYGDSRTVTVHMRRLREKVEVDPARPRHLRTVWGVGYKFEP
jgi:two-component system, OmpR family, response regulator ResD